MVTNNTNTGNGAPPQPATDSSGGPRGANLTDLGHTGPKAGDDTLIPGEQHIEMSQHEIRSRTTDSEETDQ